MGGIHPCPIFGWSNSPAEASGYLTLVEVAGNPPLSKRSSSGLQRGVVGGSVGASGFDQ